MQHAGSRYKIVYTLVMRSTIVFIIQVCYTLVFCEGLQWWPNVVPNWIHFFVDTLQRTKISDAHSFDVLTSLSVSFASIHNLLSSYLGYVLVDSVVREVFKGTTKSIQSLKKFRYSFWSLLCEWNLSKDLHVSLTSICLEFLFIHHSTVCIAALFWQVYFGDGNLGPIRVLDGMSCLKKLLLRGLLSETKLLVKFRFALSSNTKSSTKTEKNFLLWHCSIFALKISSRIHNFLTFYIFSLNSFSF